MFIFALVIDFVDCEVVSAISAVMAEVEGDGDGIVFKTP